VPAIVSQDERASTTSEQVAKSAQSGLFATFCKRKKIEYNAWTSDRGTESK
jgi:hypothetical protein